MAAACTLNPTAARPIRLSFSKSNEAEAWVPSEDTGHKTSYRIGRDTSQYLYNLPSYNRITRKNLYPGIDLIPYGNQENQLEYDLVVAPNADPSRIRLRTSIPATLDAQTGDLIVGKTRQRKPIVYQGNTRVTAGLRQFAANEFGFAIGSYDRRKPLTTMTCVVRSDISPSGPPHNPHARWLPR